MKKKRLYTCNEQNRFTGVWLLAFFLFIDFMVFKKVGFNDMFKTVVMGSLAIYLIIEVYNFSSWYFPARKKRKAKENGWLYMGKYVFIEQRIRDSHKHKYYGSDYMVHIEIEIANEKIIIKDGLYSENPGYYIRKNQQCRVYRYEGEYYPESIYYEPKKDRIYIFDLCEQNTDH